MLWQVKKEVIVDVACGMAVLRGADIFVQGIMAASPSRCALVKICLQLVVAARQTCVRTLNFVPFFSPDFCHRRQQKSMGSHCSRCSTPATPERHGY